MAEREDRPPERSSGATGALKWSLVAQFVARVGSFSLGLTLARLLTPEDFGTYTVALGVFTILLTVDDLGILKGLIRWPGPIEAVAPTARTIATGSSVAIVGFTMLVAPTISKLSGTPDAAGVMRLLALGLVVDAAFQIVPGAEIHRRFRQDLWVIVEFTRFAVTAGVTIPLAITSRDVWSLAVGALAGQVASVVATMILAKVPFKYGFDSMCARELLRVSAPYALASLVGAALLNIDYLVVGQALGPEAVGFYLVAFNVSSWPPTLVGAAIRAVSIPGFSQMHHSGDDTGRLLRRGLVLVFAGAGPFVALLLAAPRSVVGTLYGDTWLPAGEALRFLSIMSVVRLLDGLVEDALFALGRSGWIVTKNVIWLTVLAAVLPIAARLGGIRGVAIAHAAIALAVVMPIFVIRLRRLHMWNSALSRAMWSIVLATTAAAMVGGAVEAAFDVGLFKSATLVGVVVSIVYGIFMMLWRRRLTSIT